MAAGRRLCRSILAMGKASDDDPLLSQSKIAKVYIAISDWTMTLNVQLCTAKWIKIVYVVDNIPADIRDWIRYTDPMPPHTR